MTQTPVHHQSTAATPQARRLYAILIGITVLFIFVQSLTAGEFISNALPRGAKEAWTNAHGLIAYPVMVFALLATIVAISRLRAVPGLAALTSLLFVGSVVQWLLGHAITTLGMNWVVPIHVVLAFVIYGLAIVLSVRSASINRQARQR
jgi:heme A synthase